MKSIQLDATRGHRLLAKGDHPARCLLPRALRAILAP